MPTHRLVLLAVIGLIYALPAQALDYRSLNEAAIMYDAPSPKGTPLYVIARQTPVEVVVALEAWSKVRDAEGSLAWVNKRVLNERRTLLVTAARAQIRNGSDANAPLVFEAEKNVVLELLEAPAGSGWAKVRHRDGPIGYVRGNQVWGL
jgi:SH3-like domain-containing protein